MRLVRVREPFAKSSSKALLPPGPQLRGARPVGTVVSSTREKERSSPENKLQ
jgi:hypothetical protein